MSTPILKLEFKGDIRRIRYSSPINTFAALKSLAAETFSINHSLLFSWIDNEGDKISLSSDADVLEFQRCHLEEMKDAPFKILLEQSPSVSVIHEEGKGHEDEYVVIQKTDDHPVIETKTKTIDGEGKTNAPKSPILPKVPLPSSSDTSTSSSVPLPPSPTPVSLEESLELLLGIFNLQALKPLVQGYLQIMLASGNERMVYLFSILRDPAFLTIVNNFKETKSFEALKEALATIGQSHGLTGFADLTTLGSILEEKKLWEDIRSNLLLPLLEAFPKLIEYFPFLTEENPFFSDASNDNSTENNVETEGKVHVHHGITCDGCGLSPIHGIRFKCTSCDNFDFCGGIFFYFCFLYFIL